MEQNHSQLGDSQRKAVKTLVLLIAIGSWFIPINGYLTAAFVALATLAGFYVGLEWMYRKLDARGVTEG